MIEEHVLLALSYHFESAKRAEKELKVLRQNAQDLKDSMFSKSLDIGLGYWRTGRALNEWKGFLPPRGNGKCPQALSSEELTQLAEKIGKSRDQTKRMFSALRRIHRDFQTEEAFRDHFAANGPWSRIRRTYEGTDYDQLVDYGKQLYRNSIRRRPPSLSATPGEVADALEAMGITDRIKHRRLAAAALIGFAKEDPQGMLAMAERTLKELGFDS